jgi:hypothetical protein
MEQLDHKVLPEQPDHRVIQARKVLPVQPDHKVQQGLWVRRVH